MQKIQELLKSDMLRGAFYSVRKNTTDWIYSKHDTDKTKKKSKKRGKKSEKKLDSGSDSRGDEDSSAVSEEDGSENAGAPRPRKKMTKKQS